jgi:hypothetical protein
MGTLTSRMRWFYQTIRMRNPHHDVAAASARTEDPHAGDPTLVTARALGDVQGPVLIEDSVGPRDTDHYFAFSLHAPGTLVIRLATTAGVAGMQVMRGVSTGGAIDPGEVLSTSSTLVDNPVMVCRSLHAGSYFVRVYHIDSGDQPYDLSLTVVRAERDQIAESFDLAKLDARSHVGHGGRLRVAALAARGRILHREEYLEL